MFLILAQTCNVPLVESSTALCSLQRLSLLDGNRVRYFNVVDNTFISISFGFTGNVFKCRQSRLRPVANFLDRMFPGAEFRN